jgi:hypothetical protein
MNPCKIIILGDFWDCQIYRNRLYLWYSNGRLRVVDWGLLIDFFIEDEYDRLAFNCAFLQGSLLYGDSLKVLFNDVEFKELLRNKFIRIINRELVINENLIERFSLSDQDNPFKELQTDSEILNNNIYAATYNGIYGAAAHRTRAKLKVNPKSFLVNDFIAYSLKAGKYAKIALSGGDEGLYQYNASDYDYGFFEEENHPLYIDGPLKQISARHSSFADYNYTSIYNTSLIGDSFLSFHKWERNNQDDRLNIVFDRDINESTIFGNHGLNGLSWGTNEKIYYAADNTLEVVRFKNYNSDDELFTDRKTFNFQAWKGRILKGGISYFGTIIECENALVVLSGDDNFYNIQGEITRWRVYPRSINYENHLHVIKNDRLEIYSFNDDYFKNQDDKDFGIQFQKKNFSRRK